MGSSVPAALDYLADRIHALPAVKGTPVSDGWPAQRGDRLIAIGVTPEEDDSGILARYAELSREEYESVEVPSIVIVRCGGAGAAKKARQEAFRLFDAIRTLIREDRRLGGAIVPGTPARVARWAMDQTANARQAGEGRTCEIRWTLTWEHRG